MFIRQLFTVPTSTSKIVCFSTSPTARQCALYSHQNYILVNNETKQTCPPLSCSHCKLTLPPFASVTSKDKTPTSGNRAEEKFDFTDHNVGSAASGILNFEDKDALEPLSDDDSDSDCSDNGCLNLALDISNINDEDKAVQKAYDNDASFRMEESFIQVDGLQIRNSGLAQNSNHNTSAGKIFAKMKAGGGAAGIGGMDAKDSMMTLSVLGRGASGVVRKALHVPSLTLVALKEISVFDDEKRHQMVRELKVSGVSEMEGERDGDDSCCLIELAMIIIAMGVKSFSVPFQAMHCGGIRARKIAETTDVCHDCPRDMIAV